MSSVGLDGSHTPALRGDKQMGYQGRKRRKTTDTPYLTDRQVFPISISSSKNGEYHDIHDIGAVMEAMLCDLEKSKVRADGLFLNADAGFDCDILRSMPERNDIIPNICISK